VLRQYHPELDAVTGLVHDLDLATVVGDDSVGDGEPEPGAVLLGRVEGGEDAAQRLDRDAAAGVGDPHADGFLAVHLVGPRMHHQLAAAPHGVDGVQDDVDEHLLQLLTVPQKAQLAARKTGGDANLLLLQGWGDHCQRLLDDVGQVAAGVTDGRLFGEQQDLGEDRLQPEHLAHDQVGMPPFVGVLGQLPGQAPGKTADGDQRPLQLVGDSRSHLADGRQALLLEQALLGLAELPVGVLNLVVEDGVLDRHAGLVGEKLQEAEILLGDRGPGQRIVHHDRPHRLPVGDQRRGRVGGAVPRMQLALLALRLARHVDQPLLQHRLGRDVEGRVQLQPLPLHLPAELGGPLGRHVLLGDVPAAGKQVAGAVPGGGEGRGVLAGDPQHAEQHAGALVGEKEHGAVEKRGRAGGERGQGQVDQLVQLDGGEHGVAHPVQKGELLQLLVVLHGEAGDALGADRLGQRAGKEAGQGLGELALLGVPKGGTVEQGEGPQDPAVAGERGAQGVIGAAVGPGGLAAAGLAGEGVRREGLLGPEHAGERLLALPAAAPEQTRLLLPPRAQPDHDADCEPRPGAEPKQPRQQRAGTQRGVQQLAEGGDERQVAPAPLGTLLGDERRNSCQNDGKQRPQGADGLRRHGPLRTPQGEHRDQPLAVQHGERQELNVAGAAKLVAVQGVRRGRGRGEVRGGAPGAPLVKGDQAVGDRRRLLCAVALGKCAEAWVGKVQGGRGEAEGVGSQSEQAGEPCRMGAGACQGNP